MKILFRCDSSTSIGTGHIIRCLTLATSLEASGHTALFVCRNLDGNIINLIEEKQFKVISLPAPSAPFESKNLYDQWRAVPLNQEITELRAIIERENPQWIVVDHYGLPVEWETNFRNQNTRIFVIDDIFREHRCDALLDQNFHFDHSKKLNTNEEAKLFLGPRYALLSNQFLKVSPSVKSSNEVKQTLVFFGGTDPQGETLRFIKIIKKNHLSGNFQILAGSSNPHLNEITHETSQSNNMTLIIQTKNMSELMNSSDLFIGAGGSTSWERCYLGLPSIIVSIAENQEVFSENLAKADCQIYLGPTNRIDENDYLKAIKMITENAGLREKLSFNSLNLQVGTLTKELVNFFDE